MSNYPNSEDMSVDRRQETVVTQQPGYAATEQVTRDVASEKRQTLFQINRILYTLLGALEILLAARFVLKLIAANPNSGFAAFIYGLSGVFVAPFNGLIATPASGGTNARRASHWAASSATRIGEKPSALPARSSSATSKASCAVFRSARQRSKLSTAPA